MAEGGKDVVIVNNNAPGTGPPMGPINTLEAEVYCMGIEKIMDDFRELLNEDRKDALVMMVRALKRHMAQSWENMAGTEVDTVMRTNIGTIMCDALPITGGRHCYGSQPRRRCSNRLPSPLQGTTAETSM